MEIIVLIGRVVFGGFFLYNAYGHLVQIEGTSGYAKMKGIPMPKIATAATGIMLLLGGLSLLLGTWPLIGIFILLAFMIPMTLVMHQFWTIADPMQQYAEKIQFSKNMAIIGALLMLIPLAKEAWTYALTF